MRKKDKADIEVVTKPLEQYDLFEHDEMFKKHRLYSRPIGMFLIAFSRLEYFLNYMIVKSINERSDEPGLRVLKYLELGDKINLAHDQYRRLVSLLANLHDQEKQKEKIKVIITKLRKVNEFRNVVAHANWITLDKRGFVRVDIKENAGDGSIYFKNSKITPAILSDFVRQSDALGRSIVSFVDRLDLLMRVKVKSPKKVSRGRV